MLAQDPSHRDSRSSTTDRPTARARSSTRSPRPIRKVHVIHRAGKLGLGTAYIAGFRWALERKYDLVFEMDADFSHNPERLPEFLAAIRDADLVLGSRYQDGHVNVVNWPMSRLFLSYAREHLRALHHRPSSFRRDWRLQMLPSECT